MLFAQKLDMFGLFFKFLIALNCPTETIPLIMWAGFSKKSYAFDKKVRPLTEGPGKSQGGRAFHKEAGPLKGKYGLLTTRKGLSA